MTATLHAPRSCWHYHAACVHCSAATATAGGRLLSRHRHAVSRCSSKRCTGSSCCHTAVQRNRKAHRNLVVPARSMRG